MNGEHATTVNGKEKDITRADLIAVGVNAGMRASYARELVDSVESVAYEELEDVLNIPTLH